MRQRKTTYDLSSLDLVDLSPVVEDRNQLATGFSALHEVRKIDRLTGSVPDAAAYQALLDATTQLHSLHPRWRLKPNEPPAQYHPQA